MNSRAMPIQTTEQGTDVSQGGMQKPEGTDPINQTVKVDWPRWMRGLGRHTRRLREFLGLSQEQLARIAGVSQGAISRLEAGRGLATPLLVVMKINIAVIHALR